MPELNKRKIIIISVMVLAILYGAYEVLGTKMKKAPAVSAPSQSAAETQKFIADVKLNLSQEMPSAFDSYVIGRAESAWLHDPFLQQKTYREWKIAKEPGAVGTDGAKGVVFNYTGYLDAGKNSMAIINGTEYRTGEALDTEGYILKSISPIRVVIANKADRTSFEVPIQE